MGRRLIFIVLYLLMATAALGQSDATAPAHAASARPAGPRALNKTEGRRVLAAISAVDADSDSETDCSHLVHAIYEKAGFP